MKLGLIGVGVVGGTLKKYLELTTTHELRCYDPAKGMNDDLTGIDACFISVPVPANDKGQDLTILKAAVEYAKTFTPFIFVRSTVLPNTNDSLGTISMPEFLTERFALEEMRRLPIIVGEAGAQIANNIFNQLHTEGSAKEIWPMKNVECELAKFTHNCFGAMKVTYFNFIYSLCQRLGADYSMVQDGALMTGFISSHHTAVPGHDGKYGYGGKCFPENMAALMGIRFNNGEVGLPHKEFCFLDSIHSLNSEYRFSDSFNKVNEYDKDAT